MVVSFKATLKQVDLSSSPSLDRKTVVCRVSIKLTLNTRGQRKPCISNVSESLRGKRGPWCKSRRYCKQTAAYKVPAAEAVRYKMGGGEVAWTEQY